MDFVREADFVPCKSLNFCLPIHGKWYTPGKTENDIAAGAATKSTLCVGDIAAHASTKSYRW